MFSTVSVFLILKLDEDLGNLFLNDKYLQNSLPYENCITCDFKAVRIYFKMLKIKYHGNKKIILIKTLLLC